MAGRVGAWRAGCPEGREPLARPDPHGSPGQQRRSLVSSEETRFPSDTVAVPALRLLISDESAAGSGKDVQ